MDSFLAQPWPFRSQFRGMGSFRASPGLKELSLRAALPRRRPHEIPLVPQRLRLASKHFAELVGLSSEQYSRIENAAATVTLTVERVVRLLYATLAKLPNHETEEVAKTKWNAELSHEQRIVACGRPIPRRQRRRHRPQLRHRGRRRLRRQHPLRHHPHPRQTPNRRHQNQLPTLDPHHHLHRRHRPPQRRDDHEVVVW